MTAYTWNAAADGAASVSTNWSPNGVPGSGDTVTFNSTSVKNCTWDIATQITTTTIVGAGNYTGTITVSGVDWDTSGNWDCGTDAIGAQPAVNTGANKIKVGGTTNIWGGAVTINGTAAAFEVATITIHNPFGNVVLDGTSPNAFFVSTSCTLENTGRFTVQNNTGNAVSITGNTTAKSVWATNAPSLSGKVNFGSAANKGVDFSTNSLAFNPSTATVTNVANPSDMGNFTMNAAGTLNINVNGCTFKSYTQSAGTATPTATTTTMSCSGNWQRTGGNWTDLRGEVTLTGTGNLSHIGGADRPEKMIQSGAITTTLTGTANVHLTFTMATNSTLTASSAQELIVGSTTTGGAWNWATGNTIGSNVTVTLVIFTSGTFSESGGTFSNLTFRASADQITLGAALTCNQLELNGSSGNIDLEVNNQTVTIGSLLLSTPNTPRLLSTVGTPTITCNGDWNASAGWFVKGSTTVDMKTDGSTITAGANSDQFHGLTINGNVTITGVSVEVETGGSLTVATSKTLTLNAVLSVRETAVANISNSGVISGSANFAATSTTNSNLSPGEISTPTFQIRGDAAGVVFTMQALIAGSANLLISGTLELDTNSTSNYAITCGNMEVQTGCQATVNNSTITVNGNFTGNAGTIDCTGSSTWTIAGNLDLGDGPTWTKGTELVKMNSVGAQMIIATTVFPYSCQWDKNGSIEKAPVGGGSVNWIGNFTISAGVNFTCNMPGSAFRFIADTAINGFSNSGTWTASSVGPQFGWFSGASTTVTLDIGDIDTGISFLMSGSATGTKTLALGSACQPAGSIGLVQATTGSLVLDTTGTNHPVNCTDLTLQAGCTIIANGSVITASGNVDVSPGVYTYATSTLTMTGAGKSLTTGGSADEFYNLNISNTVTLAGVNTTVYGVFTNTSTFTINLMLTMQNATAINGFDNSGGTLNGSSILRFTTGSTLTFTPGNFGTIQVNVYFTEFANVPTYDLQDSLSTTQNVLVQNDAVVNTTGFDRPITCVDLTLSNAGSTLLANGSVITASGNVSYAGVFTAGTSELRMSGAATTLNTGGNSLNDYTVSGTVSLLTNNCSASGALNISAGSLDTGTLDLSVGGTSAVTGNLVTAADAAGASWTLGGTVTVAGTMTITVTSGLFDLYLLTGPRIRVGDSLQITTHATHGNAVMSQPTGARPQLTGGEIVVCDGVYWDGVVITGGMEIVTGADMRGAYFAGGTSGIIRNSPYRRIQHIGSKGARHS